MEKEMKTINMFSPDIAKELLIKEQKRGVNNIKDSYNNDWDVLAELLQNAVDAINLNQDSKKGEIKISIDAKTHTIIIEDDGIGMSYEDVDIFLRMHGTSKTDGTTIGNKGVGLKFAIYCCNNFEMETRSNGTITTVTTENALEWLNQKELKPVPDLKVYKEGTKKANGTRIELRKVDNFDFFKKKEKEIEFILRTRTAVGNTNKIWGDTVKEISVLLDFTDEFGEEKKRKKIEYKYLLISDDKKLTLQTSDLDKRKESLDHHRDTLVRRMKDYIYEKGKIIRSTYEEDGIKIYSCMVFSRLLFKEYSNDFLGLSVSDDKEKSAVDPISFENGIFIASKGMPTTISIKPPTVTRASYRWNNIFILLQQDNIEFDLGRRDIQKKYLPKVNKVLYNWFKKNIVSYESYFPKVKEQLGYGETKESTVDKWLEIYKMLDIDGNKINHQKKPMNSEAMVASIFFELIGRGVFKKIKPYHTHYPDTYDLYAEIKSDDGGTERVVIEFKSKLENIIKEFNDGSKSLNEINYIVCWAVTDIDIKNLKPYEVKEIMEEEKKRYLYANYIITGDKSECLVIDLKKTIEEML